MSDYLLITSNSLVDDFVAAITVIKLEARGGSIVSKLAFLRRSQGIRGGNGRAHLPVKGINREGLEFEGKQNRKIVRENDTNWHRIARRWQSRAYISC